MPSHDVFRSESANLNFRFADLLPNCLDKHTRKGAAHPEEHNQPERSDYKCEREVGCGHENVKAKNIDDHRSEKKQPQRDVSVCEQEQTTDDLSQKYDGIEM